MEYTKTVFAVKNGKGSFIVMLSGTDILRMKKRCNNSDRSELLRNVL